MKATQDSEHVAQIPKVLQNLSLRRKLDFLATVPCVAVLLITCLAIAGTRSSLSGLGWTRRDLHSRRPQRAVNSGCR